MKYLNIIILCLLSLSLLSCEEDEKIRQAEVLKAQKYNDSILQIISSRWRFDIPAVNAKVQQRIGGWAEWNNFKNELAQKPTGNIEAYRQKSKNLVEKAELLRNNIPVFFDKPQVRSRIGVLITKTKSMYTYISLDIAKDKKVVDLIGEISHETASIQNQFDEIIRFNEVPKEAGEDEMLRALDTTRMANPDAQPQPATGAQATPQTDPVRRVPASSPLLQNPRRMKQLTPVN